MGNETMFRRLKAGRRSSLRGTSSTFGGRGGREGDFNVGGIDAGALRSGGERWISSLADWLVSGGGEHGIEVLSGFGFGGGDSCEVLRMDTGRFNHDVIDDCILYISWFAGLGLRKVYRLPWSRQVTSSLIPSNGRFRIGRIE